MQPRRERRIAEARRRTGRDVGPGPEPLRPPPPPPQATERPDPTHAPRHLHLRPRAYATLGTLVVLVIAAWVIFGHGAHPRQAQGHPGSVAAGSGFSPTTPPALTWRSLQPVSGALPKVTAVAADPDGSLWLVATATGGAPYLLHAVAGGEDGEWLIRPVRAAGGAAVRIQTVGADKVWLAAGTQELAFDKTTHTLQTYAGAPARAAATVAGYSVGLYLASTGPPYVLVAPLGATRVQRVALPGAQRPTAAGAAAVLTGPPGTALVLVGDTVWSVDPPAGNAAAWGHLPSGGDASTATWGANRLWFRVGAGVDSLSAAAPPSALAATRTDPPADDTPLTFSNGQLWWAGAAAAYAYTPDAAAVASHPYPAPGTALLAPGPGGATWVAVDDRFTLIPGPTLPPLG